MAANRLVADSKQKAVMVYEAYFKANDKWGETLYAWQDPFGENGTGKELNPLFYGLNPFHGLPFTFLHYDVQIHAPWARGIPHILRGAQDMANIAWTWLLRVMQAGSGKWVIEENTVEKPNRALSNRLDRPVVWKRVDNPRAVAPQFIPGPQLNPAIMDFIAGTPEWMQRALNLSDVHRGVTSKRGESGEAVKAKIAQADVDIEDMRREDELSLQKLLYGTFIDLTNPRWFRLDEARRILGKDVPDGHVRTLLRVGGERAISSVTADPATMRPRTRQAVKDEFIGLAAQNIKSPEETEWELLVQSSIVTNSVMANAHRKQTHELARLIGGENIIPAMPESHRYHRWTIRDFVDTPEWHNLKEDARRRIIEHDAAHLQAEQVFAGLAGGLEQPEQQAQGSAPALPEPQGAGAVGPALSVA